MRSGTGPAAIVLDFDGLILDTEWTEYVSIHEIFVEHGTALSLDVWKSFIGSTDHPHWADMLAEQLVRPVDRPALVARRRERNRPVLEALEINPGVVALLDDADVHGVPLAVASSSPRDWVEGHLGRLGLLERFVTVSTGDDVVRTKPAPDVYLRAIASLGVPAGRTVAIEDSVNGCVAARAAAMAVVAVPSHLTADMDFAVADLVVGSVSDLDVAVLGELVADRDGVR